MGIARLCHCHDQLIQRGASLQIAQALCVGGRDIDGKKVCAIGEAREHGHVVRRAVSRGFIRAEIDPDRTARGMRLEKQALAHRFNAVIVKAETVDRRLILGQSKKARFEVAILSARRDRADLDKGQPAFEQGSDGFGVFIKARSQTKRMREIESQNFSAQHTRQRILPSGNKTSAKAAQGNTVCAFGIEGADGTQADICEKGHTASAGN